MKSIVGSTGNKVLSKLAIRPKIDGVCGFQAKEQASKFPQRETWMNLDVRLKEIILINIRRVKVGVSY
jgi:hypothetical protein